MIEAPHMKEIIQALEVRKADDVTRWFDATGFCSASVTPRRISTTQNDSRYLQLEYAADERAEILVEYLQEMEVTLDGLMCHRCHINARSRVN
jgi:hypothetical protein